MEQSRLRRLLDVGRSLSAEADPDVALARLLEVAQEVTGARYGAVGVLDEQGGGDRAMPGVPIREPTGMVLEVPIVVGGAVWATLFLSERDGREFTADDEDAVIVLADWASIAIANAQERQRRDELQRANRGLEMSTEIAQALGGETNVDRVLGLIAKRSRALIGARAAELALVDGDELVVGAVAGQGVEGRSGVRMPLTQSLAAKAIDSSRSERYREVPATSFAARSVGARSALVTPLVVRDRSIGVLSVFDRLDGDGTFSEEDELRLQTFAATAATAVATAQAATSEALQRSVQASEQERQRWARELHDETLQELAGLKLLLAGARRAADRGDMDGPVDEALELITHGITGLRAIITELRPASLDELGAAPAVAALVERVRAASGLDIDLEMRLAYEDGRTPHRHVPDVESTTYRLVQEALTNVVKHAEASHVSVAITDPDADVGQLTVAVTDDGHGFDPDEAGDGFGLIGMRERVALVGGELDIVSGPSHGTCLTAQIPVRRRAADEPAKATSSARPDRR